MIDAISPIYSLGLEDDQLDSHFDLIMTNGIPGDFGEISSKDLCLRIDGGVSLPKKSVDVYKLPFQGTYIMKSKTMDNSEKSINITFRIDREWKIYKAFEKWFYGVFHIERGMKISNALTTTDFDIRIYDEKNKVKQVITFTNAFITGLQISDLNYQTGEPLKMTCDFAFQDMIVSRP